MNSCLYCGKPVKNKYCNVSCQNRNKPKKEREIKLEKKCLKCGELFEQTILECRINRARKHCSYKCSNSRLFSEKSKKLKSKKLKGKNKIERVEIKCLGCEKIIEKRINSKRKFCTKECAFKHNMKIGKIGGKVKCKKTNKKKKTLRSKNEIHFADLCKEYFEKVLCNEPIFNGWDADVIIEDIKYAVLWNGVWHYKKITESHSVKQVQNRDRIKINEINKIGYTPYVIKDMGKQNKKFVEVEFEKFIDYLDKENIYKKL